MDNTNAKAVRAEEIPPRTDSLKTSNGNTIAAGSNNQLRSGINSRAQLSEVYDSDIPTTIHAMVQQTWLRNARRGGDRRLGRDGPTIATEIGDLDRFSGIMSDS